MQKNIITRIALCGLLTTAHVAFASEYSTKMMSRQSGRVSRSQQNKPENSNTNMLLNGYYTNTLVPNLPIYDYHKEHMLPNDASEITYINTTTNESKTVCFSGKSNLNELLTYNQEKYHVIIDSEGKDLFGIKMFQTPTPTSSNNSPIQKSGNSSPRDDYDDSKFISPTHSQSNSPTNSPRNKQLIGEVLGGEKQIVYESILENIELTDKQPNPVNRDKIIGTFTNDVSGDVYKCFSSKDLGNNQSEVTYLENEETGRIITITLPAEYNKERYIAVKENVMGLIKEYTIDLNSESDTTDTDNEESNISTNSEKTSQDSEPKQQFTGFFISEILDNMDYCEGLKIKQTHEFHTEGVTTENFTIHPIDNYQYQIEYKNKTGDICTSIVNCSQPLETTSAYIVTETDPILAIKLPTIEQIKETNSNNNNNNNDTKEDESSNLPTSRKLTGAQTSLSHFCRTPHNSMPNEYKQYEGKIIASTKQGCRVVFTDENNTEQNVWVNGTAEGATFALIKNTSNQVYCVVKLPIPVDVIDTDSAAEAKFMNNDISKKSDFERFNKNPNNRDPKYTYIGAAFLTLCIALAYKYNKLPDVCTKLLDQCFAQLNKLTPSRFSH